MLRKLLDSANMPTRRPELRAHFESNLPGVHIIGDLAGAPVVKLAMEQGHQLALHLAATTPAKQNPYDVIIAGAGAAGLNCALTLHQKGLRVLVLEKSRLANTIHEFPPGKWVYDEPATEPAHGPLPFAQAATREQLLTLWQQAAETLETHVNEPITALTPAPTGWQVQTPSAQYTATRVVIATGQSGSPRHLRVPGEDRENIHHRLYNPGHFTGENILVIGGGNTAAEAAIALAQNNQVTLLHRGPTLHRLFKANRENLEKSPVKVLPNAEAAAFSPTELTLQSGQTLKYNRAFVLIGAQPPAPFLQSLGLKLENEWTLARWLYLALALAISYTIYANKGGDNNEFWPFTGWGHAALSFAGRPWSFWYTVLYTGLMTVFGLQAAKRWGWDYKDKFQLWRYASLISFQWLFFFLIPEFLFKVAVQNQWLGEALARDPNFTNNLWRSYGLVYAWPLFFYTFLGNPHKIWVYWGLLLSFGIIPALVLFHGKRYCSWICGCGGLAETVGDRWRHLAPKGPTSQKWERMNNVVLAAAVVVTVLVLGRDLYGAFAKPAATALDYYHLAADTWLVGILPVGLYPFLGGKVWCRYWCPLAKLMELFSAWYTRMRWSRFAIRANDKCIACGECTRNCQVGIDVMKFAMLQQEITNENSTCIGCGICITVCPMKVLQFGGKQNASSLVQIT